MENCYTYFMKRFWLPLFSLLLLLLLGTSFLFLSETRKLTTRAATTGIGQFSAENTYCFVSPLRAKVGLAERVTCFILNDQGLGLSNKSVQIERLDSVNLENNVASSDKSGKVVFDIGSAKAGEYCPKVQVESAVLPQCVRLIFY